MYLYLCVDAKYTLVEFIIPQKYAAMFEKEGIGMVELPYLTEERLHLIGIPVGPRLRILQEAQLML